MDGRLYYNGQYMNVPVRVEGESLVGEIYYIRIFLKGN